MIITRGEKRDYYNNNDELNAIIEIHFLYTIFIHVIPSWISHRSVLEKCSPLPLKDKERGSGRTEDDKEEDEEVIEVQNFDQDGLKPACLTVSENTLHMLKFLHTCILKCFLFYYVKFNDILIVDLLNYMYMCMWFSHLYVHIHMHVWILEGY